ncbi:MAG: 3-isopropylmalate dehydratase, partial [Nitrospirota bacterium]
IGLPVIEVDTDKIDDGDILELDLQKGVLLNATNGTSFTFPPLPPIMTAILSEGGMIEYLKKYGDLVLKT